MISSASQSPFPKFVSPRGSRPSIGRRVFTRAPFDIEPAELPQVADHGQSYISRIPEFRFETTPGFLCGVRPLTQTSRLQPPTLHRRDRSLYAWFESVGFLLAGLSVGGACVVLVLG